LIIVGVADSKPGPDAFIGTALRVDVLLVVLADEMVYAGARLLLVKVPEGLDVYSTKKGLATRRWHDECLPMRPVDVSRHDDERRGADWTSQPSGRPATSVDPGDPLPRPAQRPSEFTPAWS
jgi:ATP-dependent DNA helicase RecG